VPRERARPSAAPGCFPSIGVHGAGFDHRTGYDSATKQTVPEAANTKGWQGGADVSWEIDIAGRLRAGAAASAAETLAAEHTVRGVRLLVMTDVATNYFTLVGALRQLDTLRAISAAQDETLRLVTARHAPASPRRSTSSARKPKLRKPAPRSRRSRRGGRIASPHRGADWRPGVQRRQHQPLARRSDGPVGACRTTGQSLRARPDLLAAQAQLEAANARRQQAMAEWFPRLFLGAVFGGEGLNVNGIALGAARFTNVAAMLAMPIFNAGRTQAINDIAESGQKEAVLHYENAIVRALEDVENTLVALDDERQRAQLLQSAAGSADSALGRAQSLYDRGRSICCRCSTRSVCGCRCASEPMTPTRKCCSTACNCTRRSAEAGRYSSLPPMQPAPRNHEPSRPKQELS
jgi:outer membrane protein TolC